MNVKIIVLLLLIMIVVSGCKNINNSEEINEVQFCTEDAKVCPDGTSVGRDPSNSCEFFECSNEKPIPVEPNGGIGNTDSYIYVEYDRTRCAATDWICIEGSTQFFDDTGCGCKADEPKKYVSNNSDECSRMRFICEANYVPFFDSEGCGCEFTFGNQEEVSPVEGKLKAIDCVFEQRNAEICTMDYVPVCGWFDSARVQCFAYPCAQTYSNACNACKNENVAYYTLGECPSVNGDDCVCPQGYVKEGGSCNPECYYSEPKCLAPSVKCESAFK